MRTADGREYLIQFKNVSDSSRDLVAERLAVVRCGKDTVWQGSVGIDEFDILHIEEYSGREDFRDVREEYWTRILVRLALPLIQQRLMSNTLRDEDKFYAVEVEQLAAYLRDHGSDGRPCEYFDDERVLASYCKLAVDRGVDRQIDRSVCRNCELPEPFLRCARLSVVAAHDTSSHDGHSIALHFACRQGRDEFTTPADCIGRRCFEYTTVEAPRSAVSDKMLRVFEQHLGFVEMQLRNDYPDAWAELCAAYDHLSADSPPEELAQAAASCRRVLSDLADHMFPAQDEERNGRKLDEESYKNRLWAYAEDKMQSSTNAALVGAGLQHLGDRIDAVHKLACKGDHADLTVDEAYRCAVHTLLLVSDLLAL